MQTKLLSAAAVEEFRLLFRVITSKVHLLLSTNDFASCLLAKELDADMLIILTAVEKVAVNFGKENEKWLDEMTVEEAQKYVDEGQFAPGSMLPKVQAAMDFASSKEGRSAMITLLEKAKDGIQGRTGTKIHI